MLYNMNWLKEGEIFPPKSEMKRITAYRDNRRLFYGDSDTIGSDYFNRVKNIVASFAGFTEIPSLTVFGIDMNYFQLVTIKTGDMVAGEPPTLGIKNKTADGALSDVKTHAGLNTRLSEVVYDVSRFGDAVTRVYLDDNKKYTFSVVSPDMWFPIFDRENNRKVIQHVIAWVELVNETTDEYVLNVQIHYKSRYDSYKYALERHMIKSTSTFTVIENRQQIDCETWRIGKLLDTKEKLETGLTDTAIVTFHNVRTSDSGFGLSDYDRISSIICELQVRYTLEALVLDKHTSPTPYGPDEALYQDKKGEWKFKAGRYISLRKDDAPPGYLVWDASLQANHTMIEKLEKHLWSLSEMGAVINDDSFGASQGYEALETRLTNAKLKARRVSSLMTEPLQLLISLLLTKSAAVAPTDISVEWNDGIPASEWRNVDIAVKKLQGGVSDVETILIEHFGKSEEEAAEIAEKILSARNSGFSRYDEDGGNGENDDKDGENT